MLFVRPQVWKMWKRVNKKALKSNLQSRSGIVNNKPLMRSQDMIGHSVRGVTYFQEKVVNNQPSMCFYFVSLERNQKLHRNTNSSHTVILLRPHTSNCLSLFIATTSSVANSCCLFSSAPWSTNSHDPTSPLVQKKEKNQSKINQVQAHKYTFWKIYI